MNHSTFKPLKSSFSFIGSTYGIFRSSSTSNCILDYSLSNLLSLLWLLQIFSTHMSKPSKVRFYHLFHNSRYFNFLSNTFVHNPILSNLFTHPTRHPRQHEVYFLVGFLPPNIQSYITLLIL